VKDGIHAMDAGEVDNDELISMSSEQERSLRRVEKTIVVVSQG